MKKLDELEELSEYVIDHPWGATVSKYRHETDPKTVIRLIKTIRAQHEALENCSDVTCGFNKKLCFNCEAYEQTKEDWGTLEGQVHSGSEK